MGNIQGGKSLKFDNRPDRKGPGGGGGKPSNPNSTQNPSKDKYRVNREIRAREVRLIDDDGKMLGVYNIHEALSLAQQRGLDLIEIAPNINPPTCKLTDYGKWKYEAKKKAQAAKKKQTIITVKEIQLRPRTDDHDLEVKIRHARRFILDGDKVKTNLRFQGREMAFQEQGMALLNRFTKELNDVALVETAPKLEGKQLFVLLAPDYAKIKVYKEKNPTSSTASSSKEAQAASEEE